MSESVESSASVISVGEAVSRHAAATPHKVAIAFEGRNTTFQKLDRAANQVANGLIALGVDACDRVAILDKNSDCYLEVWLGVSKLNAVIVPINARLAAPEVEYIVNDAKAKVLFIGEPFVAMIGEIRARLTHVQKVIVINEDYGNWRDIQSPSDVRRPIASDDVCMQIYTSGTTGHPKGVQLTNGNTLDTMADTLAAWGNWNASDVALSAMPLFHIAGCGVSLLSLVAGMKIVVVRDFLPAQIIELIQTERITVTFLVPAMIMFLLDDKSIVGADLTSLRRIVYGASPIPSKLLQRAIQRFSSAGFLQLYGLTETTGGITLLTAEDHADPESPRLKSCGRPLSGVDLRVVDADGNQVREGEVGEIICRTVKNMKGYWNRDEDTARTLRNGWLYTGDAGYLDADGYLYIHDRVKDMIVSGGENIYPAEIESAMFGHPSIADVAVIGVPDERWGEAVKALVVLKPGTAADTAATDILAYARERLAGYKVPKSIDFADALPRNPTGKILKRELREKYWKGFQRQVN
ncbi:fatty acid--CoA ligase [Bradyrhizobium pachyrhizi]|uniref:fatty acid--CoA ligase n=1 Tax=Bradyrhizobium pachyrhizi TaxID=280333 RepID=UPI00067BCE92|nr:fatty acid--CoA ligase [Bradyrhizobium pachyrhizi]